MTEFAPPAPPKAWTVSYRRRRSWRTVTVRDVAGWSFTDGGLFTWSTFDGTVAGVAVASLRRVTVVAQ
jgi:hypothetical protein